MSDPPPCTPEEYRAQINALRRQGEMQLAAIDELQSRMDERDEATRIIAHQRRVIKDYDELLAGSYKIRRDLLEKIKLLETRLASRTRRKK